MAWIGVVMLDQARQRRARFILGVANGLASSGKAELGLACFGSARCDRVS